MTIISTGNKSLWRWILFISFCSLLIIIKFVFHELWKDEWQAWLIAVNFESFQELLTLTHQEGHPTLWYLYLKIGSYPMDMLGLSNSVSLKLLHIIPVIMTAKILTFKFNLNIWLNALILFAFFGFYEYGMLSRGYVLVYFFTVVTAFLIRNIKPLSLIGLSILLLMQTEVYGVIISLVIMAYLLIEQLKNSSFSLQKYLPLFLFGLFGFILFLLSVWPSPEPEAQAIAAFTPTFGFDSLINSFNNLIAFTIIPFLSDHTSNTTLSTLLSILILVLIYFSFRKNKKALLIYSIFLVGMILFHSIFYEGALRNWSTHLIFIVFLILLTDKKKLNLTLICLLFIPQLIGTTIATSRDINMNYTNALAASEMIISDIPEETPIFCIDKYNSVPLVGYSNRELYHITPNEIEKFTYYKWGEKIYLPTQMELISAKAKLQAKEIYIITPKPLPESRFNLIKPVAVFNDESVKPENYNIYKLE